MRIGLIDVDGHNYPNLALMKLAAWHKARGDTVEWWFGWEHYDIVYMAKVFSDAYTPDKFTPANADKVIRGGSGYAIRTVNGVEIYDPELDKPLPPEVEHMMPDYSLYPKLTRDTAYGRLTVGCPKQCSWCHVCAMQGIESRKRGGLERVLERSKKYRSDGPEYSGLPRMEGSVVSVGEEQCKRRLQPGPGHSTGG